MADRSSVNGHGTARVPGSSSAEFNGVAEFVDDLASLCGSIWRGSGTSLSAARQRARTREIVYEFFMRLATGISQVFPIGSLSLN